MKIQVKAQFMILKLTGLQLRHVQVLIERKEMPNLASQSHSVDLKIKGLVKPNTSRLLSLAGILDITDYWHKKTLQIGNFPKPADIEKF